MCSVCSRHGYKSGEHPLHQSSPFITNHADGTSSSTQAFTSSSYYISALLEDFSWGGNSGVGVTVNYNFNYTAENGTLFDATLRNAALSVMGKWASVANINFASTTSTNAVLSFSKANLGSDIAGLASTFFSGTSIQGSEVQVDQTITDYGNASFGYAVLLHEVGHALGLKHPGNYSGNETGPFLPASEDTYDASIMSYNAGTYATDAYYAITPMIYDIAAIQFLYGANTGYNAGTNNYGFTGTSTIMTIWDGGGTDAIDASSYAGGGTQIDLREGISNVSVIGSDRIWVAFGANIENGIGSSFADTMYGNALGNTLYGRAGADLIHGNEGNDAIYGGVGLVDPADGNDTIYGGGGGDYLVGNAGNDLIFGGLGVADPNDGNDTIYGGLGSDAIYGNAGNDELYGGGSGFDPGDNGDTVYGGLGADAVYGNGGNDVLYGGGSGFDPGDNGDSIYGGVGDDMIYGNGGNDFINGGTGNDSVHGGVGDNIYHLMNGVGNAHVLSMLGAGTAGGDVIQVAAGANGASFASTADLLALVTYSGGNALLTLGTSTITIAGVTSLIADDFSIV